VQLLQDLRRQVDAAGGTIARIYTALFAFVAIATTLAVKSHTPVVYLTRDPAAVAELNPFIGVLSSVGILFWAFAAGVCWFCAAVLRKNAPRAARFLFHSAALTTWLMLDDQFQLHEDVFATYLHAPQPLVYGIYMVSVLVYLYHFRQEILASEFFLLALALGLFALSVAVDVGADRSHFIEELPGRPLMEDGPKLFATATWFVYFARTAAGYLAREDVRHP
jgi:hypothetical protein